jgi:hypothetical protein
MKGFESTPATIVTNDIEKGADQKEKMQEVLQAPRALGDMLTYFDAVKEKYPELKGDINAMIDSCAVFMAKTLEADALNLQEDAEAFDDIMQNQQSDLHTEAMNHILDVANKMKDAGVDVSWTDAHHINSKDDRIYFLPFILRMMAPNN